MTRCLGTWLHGSGGHRMYAHDCDADPRWDVGVGLVCDKHKVPGSDDDAWDVEDVERVVFGVRKLHDMVDQTDPNDVIGTALTRAGLARRP